MKKIDTPLLQACDESKKPSPRKAESNQSSDCLFTLRRISQYRTHFWCRLAPLTGIWKRRFHNASLEGTVIVSCNYVSTSTYTQLVSLNSHSLDSFSLSHLFDRNFKRCLWQSLSYRTPSGLLLRGFKIHSYIAHHQTLKSVLIVTLVRKFTFSRDAFSCVVRVRINADDGDAPRITGCADI